MHRGGEHRASPYCQEAGKTKAPKFLEGISYQFISGQVFDCKDPKIFRITVEFDGDEQNLFGDDYAVLSMADLGFYGTSHLALAPRAGVVA